MGKSTDYSKLSQEELAALCTEKDTAIAGQEELIKELIHKNEQLSVSETTGVPTLKVGKKMYQLITPKFYHDGKLLDIDALRKSPELAEQLVKDNTGNLEEIGGGQD